jgi:hypothetical protein
MIRKLNWELFSPQERAPAIDELKRSINRCDGNIITCEMFSDLSMNLILEIAEKHVSDLHTELQKVVDISDLDKQLISDDTENEWTILMNINFAKRTGKLKSQKPLLDN